MANEARGKLYESIVELAAKKVIKRVSTNSKVWRNEKPENMSIDPDITVGEIKDKPSHVILVTAVGSSRNAEMKSWRNLGEMFEVKAQLPEIPIVINIHFKENIKSGLADLNKEIYDSLVRVNKKSYYKGLKSWVDRRKSNFNADNTSGVELLVEDLSEDKDIERSLISFVDDLEDILQTRKREFEELWELMKEDYENAPSPPKRKETSVRRGLAKLLVLEPKIRRRVYKAWKKDSRVQDLPNYAYELDFFARTMSGGKLADEEVNNAMALLGTDRCEKLLARAPSRMEDWLNQLRQLDNVPRFVNFLRANFDKIKNPSSLESLLRECQNDPEKFAHKNNIDFEGKLTRNWLFSFLVELIKASTGKQQGYGYSELADDVGETEGISSGYISIADWANRVEGTEISDDMLSGVSHVLSDKVSDIGVDKIDKLSDKIVEFTKRSFLYARIIPYRKFEPLLWILKNELKKQGKSFEDKKPYGGWIREYTNAGGRTATTPFVRVGRTLVHWKTVSDSGRSHKKKELSGRARNVKYEYGESFKRRQDVDQLALIVDGTFRQDDLKVLVNSGWDRIVYPDEVSDFVSKL